jgi:hypothetical protein
MNRGRHVRDLPAAAMRTRALGRQQDEDPRPSTTHLEPAGLLRPARRATELEDRRGPNRASHCIFDEHVLGDQVAHALKQL